jgi:CBS domain-containing protein
MEKLNQILSRQQPHFINITPGSSIRDALCRMSTLNTEYLIVMDGKNKFLGLLTEKDIARKALFLNLSLTETKVEDLMTTQWPFADVNNTVDECMNTMKAHHVKYIPVFENLEFVGVVSADDILMEAVMQRQEIFD